MEWYFYLIIGVIIIGIILYILNKIGNKNNDIFEMGSNRMKKLSDCCKKLLNFGRA